MIGALLLGLSGAAVMPANAQTPSVVTVPGSVTSDASTHSWLSSIWNTDQEIRYSVVTGGGGGIYVPANSNIQALNEGLFSGVNASNFTELYPGWRPLPADAVDVAKEETAKELATYGNALAGAQSQGNEIVGGTNENFGGIEWRSADATTLLRAVQANTEAVLQVAEQLQYERQLIIALITVESTRAAHDLNATAQGLATAARSPLAP